jgi:hypothetical protein
VSGWLDEQLAQASPDLLRAMVKTFAEAVMAADADAICNAGYRERSPERTNRRNGYRERDWDTRTGTIELAIPKLREGSYFPGWLIEPGLSTRLHISLVMRAGDASRLPNRMVVGEVDSSRIQVLQAVHPRWNEGQLGVAAQVFGG